MITSSANKKSERLFNRELETWPTKALSRTALRKLAQVDAATGLHDLRTPPSNHLEKLSGDRRGQHSIRINLQWRICFTWRHPDAYDVEVNKHYER
ncbi:MAG: type II toxin-antitoxin system RelE/ParE family toxin [Alphaproteobacteria bacterium]|nr:type II toxin-antitoxin system RelE/ParE family toxin [Alphaproteobacteria bacterium]